MTKKKKLVKAVDIDIPVAFKCRYCSNEASVAIPCYADHSTKFLCGDCTIEYGLIIFGDGTMGF